MTDSDPRVFDGHNDTLLDLHLDERGGGRSFFERSDAGHVDLPRAREGDLAGGLFAVFVPNEEDAEPVQTESGHETPPAVDHERAKAFTHDVLARLYRIEAESEGRVRVARTVEDIESALADDALAAVPHLEGAAAVAPDLSNLDFLYAAGVRSIGLVWSRPNAFGHGVPFAHDESPDTGPGLTDAGRDLVRACNDRGIVVDLAHLNAAGFWDVAEISEDPLVVSHTAAYGLRSMTRNLTDDQLDAVADSGGVVGLTFGVDSFRADDAAVSLSALADHVEYIADRIGVDHVALGSDFDGATIPDAVGDATGLPDLLAVLRERGFGDDDLRKFARTNWLRVLDETWA